jgi:hypothetical protein
VFRFLHSICNWLSAPCVSIHAAERTSGWAENRHSKPSMPFKRSTLAVPTLSTMGHLLWLPHRLVYAGVD